MDKKEELVADIVQREWEMFQTVHNAGGRAACQDDLETFRIMRSSQAAGWSAETLQSYRQDLIAAEYAGRNLISEKYAHMMETTSPAEYAAIAHRLPNLEPETIGLVAQIVPIIMEWAVDLSRKYPYVLGRARPFFSDEDSPAVTSLETYLTGEFKTYSAQTLRSYLADVQRQHHDHINGSEITLLATVKHYGFKSLEEANEKLKVRSAGAEKL